MTPSATPENYTTLTDVTQGKRAQHGKPHGVVRDDQPDAREDWPDLMGWLGGEVQVPLKPDNAGEGRTLSQDRRKTQRGTGDWATYQLPDSVQKLQTALHAKAKRRTWLPLRRPLRQDQPRRHSGARLYAQCRSNKGAGADRQDF